METSGLPMNGGTVSRVDSFLHVEVSVAPRYNPLVDGCRRSGPRAFCDGGTI